MDFCIKRGVALLAMFWLVSSAQAQVGLLCGNAAPSPGLSTGTISNSGVLAPSGFAWSELQHNTGDLTVANSGLAYTCSGGDRCADDFDVPAGGWTVSLVYVYGIAYGATTAPFTSATVRLWGPCPGSSGPGDSGCNIVSGDTTTNRLIGQSSTSLYRIYNSIAPAPGLAPTTSYEIWQIGLTLTPGTALGAGHYWIDYDFSAASTPDFSPTITVAGRRSLGYGNARVLNGGSWVTVIDYGTPSSFAAATDFPFQVLGVGSAPANGACSDRIFVDHFGG